MLFDRYEVGLSVFDERGLPWEQAPNLDPFVALTFAAA